MLERLRRGAGDGRGGRMNKPLNNKKEIPCVSSRLPVILLLVRQPVGVPSGPGKRRRPGETQERQAGSGESRGAGEVHLGHRREPGAVVGVLDVQRLAHEEAWRRSWRRRQCADAAVVRQCRERGADAGGQRKRHPWDARQCRGGGHHRRAQRQAQQYADPRLSRQGRADHGRAQGPAAGERWRPQLPGGAHRHPGGG